jgi:hypothetical protein
VPPLAELADTARTGLKALHGIEKRVMDLNSQAAGARSNEKPPQRTLKGVSARGLKIAGRSSAQLFSEGPYRSSDPAIKYTCRRSNRVFKLIKVVDGKENIQQYTLPKGEENVYALGEAFFPVGYLSAGGRGVRLGQQGSSLHLNLEATSPCPLPCLAMPTQE